MYKIDVWLIRYEVSICTYFPMYSTVCVFEAQQYESFRETTKAEFMNVQFR
jgi:hypothetical protein